jgi:hypothetical protein
MIIIEASERAVGIETKTARLLASQFRFVDLVLTRLSAANGYPVWISAKKNQAKKREEVCAFIS